MKDSIKRYDYTKDVVREKCGSSVPLFMRTYRGLEMAVRNAGVDIDFLFLKQRYLYLEDELKRRFPQWVDENGLIVDLGEMFAGFRLLSEGLGLKVSLKYLKLQEIIFAVKKRKEVCVVIDEWYDGKKSPHLIHVGGLVTTQDLSSVRMWKNVDVKKFVGLSVNNPFGVGNVKSSENECIGGLMLLDEIEEKGQRNESGGYACICVEQK